MIGLVQRIWLILFINLWLAGSARAAEIVCGLVEPEVVQIDGLLDDWQGVRPLVMGPGSRDAGFSTRCNYDQGTVFLAIDVSDQQLVRRKKGDKGAEDTLILDFGRDRLEISPAEDTQKAAFRLRWASGASPKGIVAVDSLQPRGWSVELAIPRAKLGGGSRVALEISYRDADLFSERNARSTLSTGAGTLVLEEGAQLYGQALADLRLSPRDVWLDKMVNVSDAPGPERVIVAGRTVVILGESYFYMQLPVVKKDIKKLQLVDLAGEGRSAILVHYVERGQGGSREVVAVWNVLGDGSFARPLAVEVAKETRQGRIDSVWTLEPKKAQGKKKKKPQKGLALVIRTGQARGYTADSWNESPAEDMTPILLPWSEEKERRFHFQGEEAFGASD
jgi:hypothetical protein